MKAWMIVGIVLVLLGLALFTVMMSVNHWNFKELSTTQYEINISQVEEEFQNIFVEIDTAQFCLLPSEDGVARVECYEETKAKHTVTVENGTLHIRLKNEKKWYEHIGVNFETPKVTLYLPKTEYSSLSIKGSTGSIHIAENFCFESIDTSLSTGDVTCLASSTGDIKIKTNTGNIHTYNIRSRSLNLSVSTGSIVSEYTVCNGDVSVHVSTGKSRLSNLFCQNLISSGSTGDLTLESVTAAACISIERSTGDVTFDACDAPSLSVTTDTGDVTGTLLSDKVFIISTDTGRVSVPKTTSGGKCEITTDTGDIKLEILQ